MWTLLAEKASAGISQYLIPGIAAIVAAALTLFGSLWGTLRTTSASREAKFNERVDGELDQLREERDKARAEAEIKTADRDRYRELYAQLRLDVRAAGLNPDDIGRRSPDAAPPN